MTPEDLTEQIKDLVSAELTALKSISSGMGIGEDGLKRLALCSLILYRIRTPPEGPKKEITNEELMKGGTLNE
jgi:hypothetical protein